MIKEQTELNKKYESINKKREKINIESRTIKQGLDELHVNINLFEGLLNSYFS